MRGPGGGLGRLGRVTPTPRWSTVLFDLDGTLADTIPLIVASYQHAFRAVLGVVRQEGPAAALLRQSGIEVRVNAAPERGMGSSIAVGMAAAAAFDPEACLILLGDMPSVTKSHLDALLAAFEGEDDLVVSVSHGRRSPPSLFGRRHFSALLALDGDEGARALALHAKTVEAAAAVLGDVDRPEDVG